MASHGWYWDEPRLEHHVLVGRNPLIGTQRALGLMELFGDPGQSCSEGGIDVLADSFALRIGRPPICMMTVQC